jgi:hypothetical protein
MRWLAAAALIGICLLALGARSVQAQGPTDTPTPTYTPSITPTYTNQQRLDIATIVPPPSCGTTFTPCGALPWPIPTFATLALPSPTLNPASFSSVPTNTPTPGTPTATGPTATTTPHMDLSGINTLQAGVSNSISTLTVQTTAQFVLEGTPSGAMEVSERLGGYAGTFFGYAKALQLLNFRGTGGIIFFILAMIAFAILVKFVTFILPILISLFRLVLEAFQAIKPF